MECIRCRGLLVEDHLLDFEAGYGEMWARSWRCVNCGHAHDAVTERNRLTRAPQVFACASDGTGSLVKE